jgi:predicted  nucleic acid-binding Zn-ribbon protein
MSDNIPHVPTSWGELLDKITILQIKVAHLPTDAARANAQKELTLLEKIAGPVMTQAAALTAKLKALNEQLWEIEDQIREHERAKTFDQAFIALARSVYQTNDERGRVKREINSALGSALVEEKSYKPY